jgi:hypothetical protein
VADSSEADKSIPDVAAKPTLAYRGLLAAVILLGVLIVIALGVLVAGLVTHFRGAGRGQTEAGPVEFTLAAGTRLADMELTQDRLVLRVRGPAGDEVDIIDTETGRLVAKVRAAPPQRP